MNKQFHLTKEGIEELEQELAELIAQRGPIADRIKTAREFGDLAENAEYTAARQEQERVEGRIAQIEHILKNGEVRSEEHTSELQSQSTIRMPSSA